MMSPRNRGSNVDKTNTALLGDPATRSEQAVLLELFFVSQGREWKKRTNWTSSKPLEEWHGVHTVDTLVTSIELDDNNLDGQIPSSLGLLIALKRLNLSSNNLHGILPSSFGSMVQMTILNLSHNLLSGTLPDSIHLLVSLVDLNLSWNNLEGQIPDWIGDLTRLRQLDIENNYFSHLIPSSIRTCACLRKLKLSNNQLEGEIPICLSAFNYLVELTAANNKFRGQIPSAVASLPNLKMIDFGDNELSGSIPPRLLESPNLRELRLHSNHFRNNLSLSSIDWTQTVSLICLDLHDNQLFGSIPDAITAVPNLAYLILSSNHFSGNLHQFLLRLSSSSCIVNLNLANNQIDGSIPACIERLVHVVNLDLSNNLLTGSIPSSLSKLNRLTSLNLSNNQLYGEIPAPVLGLFPSLLSLSLTGNQLTLPSAGLNAVNFISNLNLDNQGLVGRIPACIGDLTNLQSLILSNNFFTGSIPDQAMKLNCKLFTVEGNLMDNYPSDMNAEFPNLRSEFEKMHSTDRTKLTMKTSVLKTVSATLVHDGDGERTKNALSIICRDADVIEGDLTGSAVAPSSSSSAREEKQQRIDVEAGQDNGFSSTKLPSRSGSDSKSCLSSCLSLTSLLWLLLMTDLALHLWATNQLKTLSNPGLFIASVFIYVFGGVLMILRLWTSYHHPDDKNKTQEECCVSRVVLSTYFPVISLPLAVLTVYAIIHFSATHLLSHKLKYYQLEKSLWLSLAVAVTFSALYYYLSRDLKNLNQASLTKKFEAFILRYTEIGSRISTLGFFASYTLGWGVLIWIFLGILISKTFLKRIIFHKNGHVYEELNDEFSLIFAEPCWVLDHHGKSSKEVAELKLKMSKMNLIRMTTMCLLLVLLLIFGFRSWETDNGLGILIVTIVDTCVFLIVGGRLVLSEYRSGGAVVALTEASLDGAAGVQGNSVVEMTDVVVEHK